MRRLLLLLAALRAAVAGDPFCGAGDVCFAIGEQPVSNERRREAVRAALQHAWWGYSRFAWGADELLPHAQSARNWTSNRSLGLTIVDSLDTLWLMNMHEDFHRGVEWVERHLTFDTNVFVNLFEISIRCLGGLLSAFHLSGDAALLDKARELGSRLMPGLESSTSGVPFSDVNLRTGIAEAVARDSSLSEATSIQLEFKYLSNVTGEARYASEADEAMEAVFRASKTLQSEVRHVLPLFISPVTGQFRAGVVSLGARGDSYYEYLLKQFLLSGKKAVKFRAAYLDAVDAIKTHLVRTTKHRSRFFVGELHGASGGFHAKMDHLVCFLPGTLALGVLHGIGRSPADLRETLELAEELMETCYQLYNSTPTGLGPEIAHFETAELGKPSKGQPTKDADIFIKHADAHYILRPEVVESLFLLHRATGHQKYRDYGWRIFEAIEQYCRVPTGGYAGVNNVLNREFPGVRDNMETFFTGETLKYLFLLFSSEDALDLHDNVLSTEAHIFPIFS